MFYTVGAICSIYIMIAIRYATLNNFANCQKLIRMLLVGDTFCMIMLVSSDFGVFIFFDKYFGVFILHSIIMMELWNSSITKLTFEISIS